MERKKKLEENATLSRLLQELGIQVRTIRKRSDISIKDLSAMSEKGEDKISNLEFAKVDYRISLLLQVVDALGYQVKIVPKNQIK
jgi:predicted transcriptional regulator